MEVKDIQNEFNINNVEVNLKNNYIKALRDDDFKKLILDLKIKDELAVKYTTKLQKTVCDLNNCKKCKGLNMCLNNTDGVVYFPRIDGKFIEFDYVECKYKTKDNKEKSEIKTKFYDMPSEIKRARIKDIEITSNRSKVIKWITKFYDAYKNNSAKKGLYLEGSFGSGKTFIVSSLLNELAKDGYSAIIVYYPELIRSFKESFAKEEFEDRMREIQRCDLLLLDDIGAEAVSAWNRDEILGNILQYRMDNKKKTFFTSNYSLDDLEGHFIIKQGGEDKIKSRRIMERIRFLTDDIELVGENRRK